MDLSDLMSDPDFAQEFKFKRRTVSVDPATGLGNETFIILTGCGSIQPLSGQTLRQMPALAQMEGTIEIWTTAGLRLLTDSNQPDIILYEGSEYLVSAIPGNWARIGGFRKYVGTLRPLVLQPMGPAI
jgi:hypothetical protein